MQKKSHLKESNMIRKQQDQKMNIFHRSLVGLFVVFVGFGQKIYYPSVAAGVFKAPFSFIYMARFCFVHILFVIHKLPIHFKNHRLHIRLGLLKFIGHCRNHVTCLRLCRKSDQFKDWEKTTLKYSWVCMTLH